MKDLGLAFVLMMLIVGLLWGSAIGQEYYETYPGTGVPDLSKPVYTESNGVLYEVYPNTTVPDISKPRITTPKKEPAESGRESD